MADLYHIPHDDGKTYRLKKFVEYQHEVPSIHYRFAGEYAKRNGMTKDEIVKLCWYIAVTYNELTAVLLHQMSKTKSLEEICQYCDKFIFGSASKWNKYNGRFEWLMQCGEKTLTNQPYEWLKSCECEIANGTYITMQKRLRRIPEFGRMQADLFQELVVFLKDELSLNIAEPSAIDWDNGANLVSATFNIFYEDERANAFDKGKRLTAEEKTWLSIKLKTIQRAIQKEYPTQNAEISMFIGKLCSFRNLFKGQRYGGYHHDRELEWLLKYERIFPEYQALWNEARDIRKTIFPHRFLGELNGWNGIRKERKKLWITKGLTGVEEYER